MFNMTPTDRPTYIYTVFKFLPNVADHILYHDIHSIRNPGLELFQVCR